MGLLKAQVSPYSHICLPAWLLRALELACAEVTKESGNKSSRACQSLASIWFAFELLI